MCPQGRDWRKRRARAGGNQAAVEVHLVRAAVSGRHGQRARVPEPGLAAQHGDGRSACQDAFVLGMAQLLDAALLLGQQPLAQYSGRCGRQASIERAFAAQVDDVRGADHDLGRHAADIDAGAADGAALDQRDAGALLHGLQGSRHRRAAAAYHSHVQRLFTANMLRFATEPAQRLV